MDYSAYASNLGVPAPSSSPYSGLSYNLPETTPAPRWTAPMHERPYYDQLFQVADVSRTQRIAGKEAVEFFQRSTLPIAILKEIWSLSEEKTYHFLDREAFNFACRLIALAQEGIPARPGIAEETAHMQILPKFQGIPLPTPSYGAGPPPSTTGPPPPTVSTPNPPTDIWSTTPEERQGYSALFAQTDTDGDGYISGIEAATFFKQSGAKKEDLRSIWNLSDIDKDGSLDLPEFIVAMHLIIKVTKGGQTVPESLPRSLIPPSKSSLIISSGTPTVGRSTPVNNSTPLPLSTTSTTPTYNNNDAGRGTPTYDTSRGGGLDLYATTSGSGSKRDLLSAGNTGGSMKRDYLSAGNTGGSASKMNTKSMAPLDSTSPYTVNLEPINVHVSGPSNSTFSNTSNTMLNTNALPPRTGQSSPAIKSLPTPTSTPGLPEFSSKPIVGSSSLYGLGGMSNNTTSPSVSYGSSMNDDLLSDSKTMNSDLKNQKDNLSNLKEGLASNSSQSSKILREMQSERQQILSEISSITDILKSEITKTSSINSEISQLQSEISKLRNELNGKIADLQKEKISFTTLSVEKSHLLKNMEAINQEIDSENTERATLQSNLHSLENEVAALKSEIATNENNKKNMEGNPDIASAKRTATEKKKMLLKLKQENELLREKVSIQKDTAMKLKNDRDMFNSVRGGGEDLSLKLKSQLQKEIEDTEAAIKQEQAIKDSLKGSTQPKGNISPSLPTRTVSKPVNENTTPIASPSKVNGSAFVPFDSAASSRTGSVVNSPVKKETAVTTNAFDAFDAFGKDDKVDSSAFDAFGSKDSFGSFTSSPSKASNAFDSFDAFPTTTNTASNDKAAKKNDDWDSFGTSW